MKHRHFHVPGKRFPTTSRHTNKPLKQNEESDFYDLFQPIPDPHSENFRRLVRFCTQNATAVLASLPFFLSELAGIYGFTVTLAFLRKHSGRRIKLPDDPKRFTQLYGLPVTTSDYVRLQRVCGAEEYVDLSSTGGVLTSLRRIAVADHLRRFDKPEDTARLFGVTVRYTRKLREKPAVYPPASPPSMERRN